MSQFIPFQSQIRQPLPIIRGSKDYQDFRRLLDRIDHILTQSGIEQEIVSKYLEIAKRDKYLSYPKAITNQKQIRKALCCSIARNLTGLSFRKFRVRVADSPILQRFLRINEWGIIRVPSKSQCQRYEEMFSSEMIAHIIILLNQSAGDPGNLFQLENPVSLKEFYIDSTCVDANVHFPVDWVLLRDAVRTLIESKIKKPLIRQAGSAEAFVGSTATGRKHCHYHI
ncbi:hypothetical protein K8T06_12080 [bacterium]|nr:hypothetical protein [bacterium]